MMKQLLRFLLFFLLIHNSHLEMFWSFVSKTDHNWFFLSVKLVSGISDSLKKGVQGEAQDWKSSGFYQGPQLSYQTCVTTVPQCPFCCPKRFHTQCSGALDLFGGAGGVQWDMMGHGSCLFSLCISLGQGVCRDMGGDLSQPVQNWRLRACSFVAVYVSEVCGRRETLRGF